MNVIGAEKSPQKVDKSVVETAVGKKMPLYDKSGDYHYDNISAFINLVGALRSQVGTGQPILLLATACARAQPS